MANNILGKDNGIPYGNINLKYASDGVHYPGGFGSNESSLQFGLPNSFRDNISAANASNLKGGRRKKNITNKYKKMGKGRSRRVKSKTGGKRKSRRVKRTMKNRQRGGGYHQFGSNIPSTASYSTGGPLNPRESYLANPVKFDKILGNTVDNYNYNTNKGFQFW